eukprot:gene2834-1819_t
MCCCCAIAGCLLCDICFDCYDLLVAFYVVWLLDTDAALSTKYVLRDFASAVDVDDLWCRMGVLKGMIVDVYNLRCYCLDSWWACVDYYLDGTLCICVVEFWFYLLCVVDTCILLWGSSELVSFGFFASWHGSCFVAVGLRFTRVDIYSNGFGDDLYVTIVGYCLWFPRLSWGFFVGIVMRDLLLFYSKLCYDVIVNLYHFCLNSITLELMLFIVCAGILRCMLFGFYIVLVMGVLHWYLLVYVWMCGVSRAHILSVVVGVGMFWLEIGLSTYLVSCLMICRYGGIFMGVLWTCYCTSVGMVVTVFMGLCGIGRLFTGTLWFEDLPGDNFGSLYVCHSLLCCDNEKTFTVLLMNTINDDLDIVIALFFLFVVVVITLHVDLLCITRKFIGMLGFAVSCNRIIAGFKRWLFCVMCM